MIGDQSSSNSERVLAKSEKYQREAINSFLEEDFECFLDSMTKALNIFDGTSNSLTIIISSTSAGVVLLGIIVLTSYVWKKRKK